MAAADEVICQRFGDVFFRQRRNSIPGEIVNPYPKKFAKCVVFLFEYDNGLALHLSQKLFEFGLGEAFLVLPQFVVEVVEHTANIMAKVNVADAIVGGESVVGGGCLGRGKGGKVDHFIQCSDGVVIRVAKYRHGPDPTGLFLGRGATRYPASLQPSGQYMRVRGCE